MQVRKIACFGECGPPFLLDYLYILLGAYFSCKMNQCKSLELKTDIEYQKRLFVFKFYKQLQASETLVGPVEFRLRWSSGPVR